VRDRIEAELVEYQLEESTHKQTKVFSLLLIRKTGVEEFSPIDR
jgi:hypothetical protein